MKRRRGRSESGISLAEVTVTLFLMSILSVMFHQLYMGTVHSTIFFESKNDLALFGQQTVNRIKLEVMQSRTIFQNDTLGQGYLAALDLPAHRPLLDDSRLPTANPNGAIEPDGTGEIFTGNCLLQARHLTPEIVVVDHDGDSSTADVEFRADRYRFDFYYLAKVSDRPLRPLAYSLDLMEFQSVEFVDYFQLRSLDATFRSAVVTALHGAGYTRAWEPGAAIGSAMRTLNSDGSISSAIATPTIPPEEVGSAVIGLHGGRISGNMTYSVGAMTSPPLETPDPVQVYAQPNKLFPGGFEVLVIGPTGARKVNLRLMLVSQSRNDVTSRVNTVTITTAEF